MSKTIEIRLSDAQHAALTAEVEASGERFFDYCRAKLLAGANAQTYGIGPAMRELPAIRAENERKLAEARIREAERFPPRVIPEQDDRISRIEDAVARLAEIVLQRRAEPDPIDQDDEPQPTGTQDDFETIMARRMSEAGAQGLTRPQAAPVQEQTDDDRDYEMVGVRPFRKPGPPAFSALGTSNRITRERV